MLFYKDVAPDGAGCCVIFLDKIFNRYKVKIMNHEKHTPILRKTGDG